MNISPETENISRETDFGLLRNFTPIFLGEMDSISLMNRIDRKFLTDKDTLMKILADALTRGYRIFEKDGVRQHSYDSIYFDTAELRMFKEHRRGKAVREKVRTRSYVESDQFYLEVKRKNNHRRTKKKRTAISAGDFEDFRGDAEVCRWLSEHCSYSAEMLFPSVETSFRRITLVDNSLSERLTVDLDVGFSNLRNGAGRSLSNTVIIELKQDGRVHSEMQDILLLRRVKPVRVSKYCMGVVTTDPNITLGRFKEKLRVIEHIENLASPV